MNVEQYKLFLKESLVNNPHRAIFVMGGVGVGKSECTKQVADELGWEFRDIRLSMLDVTDLRGLPTIDKEKRETIWTRPVFLPPEDYKKDVLLFFDEFNTANKSMMNGALSLMLDRCIGEYRLPDNVRVVCAGNDFKSGAFINKLSAPLNNRLIHINFEPNFDCWKIWAYKNNINPLIIGFHNYRKGDLLYNYKEDVENDAFASPRTWFFTDEILKLKLNNGTLYETIKGTIGEAVGVEFYGWLKVYKDLPKPEDILLKGKDIIPKESNIMYALISALINCVKQHKNKMDRLVEYSMKIPKEFSVVLIKDLLKTEMGNDVMATNAFEKWGKMNEDVILNV